MTRGNDYSGFASAASTAFVRETWESVVVSQHNLFIGLLIAFAVATRALVLTGGRVRQASLLLLIAFNVALVPFGWGYLVWSVPMAIALWLLWRAGRQVPATAQRLGQGPRRTAAAGRARPSRAFAEPRLENVTRAAQMRINLGRHLRTIANRRSEFIGSSPDPCSRTTMSRPYVSAAFA